MAVVKNMIVRVGADLSGLISGFGKASGVTGSFVKQTEKAMQNSTLSLGNLKKAMAQGGKNAAIISLTDQIRELEAEQKALKAAGFSWGYEGFEGNEALLRDLKSQLNDYIKSLEETGEETEETARKTSRLGAAARSALGWVKETASKALGIGKNAKGSTAGIESLVRSIRRIGLVSIGLRLVKSIFGELQSVVTQHISQNAALQAQVNALKTSLGQALAPAINLVANAMSALMPYVVGVSNAIGSLISNLFGSGWSTVANSANAAAEAIGGAGGAQKEFNRQLAGFDEITKLNKDSSGGGGGPSSVTTPTESITPTWLTSLSQQIQQAAGQGDFFGIGAAIANAVNGGINSINLSDTTLGSKIAGFINGGISGAAGFLETMDWSGLGTAIKNNVSGLIGGIDWSGAFSALGSAAGGIATAIGSLFSDAIAGAKEHFSESVEQCGGDILAGVLLGIGKAIAGIGTWIKDNIFSPFIEGFKKTFDIHSPSQNEEINSLGKNILLGIFQGITDALSDPVGWIKENVFTPLVNGFKKVFGEDGFFTKLFSGENGENQKVEVDAEAKLTSWKDQLRNKSIAFKTRLTTWSDNLKNKSIAFQSKLTTWKDNLTNKVIDFQSRLTTWKDDLKSKVIDFLGNLTSWKDSLSNKSIDFHSNMTTWTDSLSNKSIPFISNLTSWWDGLTDKNVDFNANFTTWQDHLSQKTVEMLAKILPGWTGTLEDALNIATLYARLSLSLPVVTVKWEDATDPMNVLNSTRIPYYDQTWRTNEYGGILSSASVFAKIGNTLQVGGEAGREALLPLDRHTGWMDKIADRVALRVVGGGTGGEQTITVNLVVDGRILASTVVRHVNAQAKATGKNPLAAYL